MSTPGIDAEKSAARVAAVTGASGFIGGHLVSRLFAEGYQIRKLSRDKKLSDIDVDFDDFESLVAALNGVDVVFHCAGRAHAFNVVDDESLHRYANEFVTLNTARAAAKAGVRRFVFLSSVKAAGDPGEKCADESFAKPAASAYGRSKRAAEVGLQVISAQTQLQTICLRLAMVYGTGGRGNLERMMRAVDAGWFPPLPETNNRRSLVHIDDVLDTLVLVAEHNAAVGGVYIVAHPMAVSGRELYAAMCEVLGKGVPRFAIPAWLLRLVGIAGDFAGKVSKRRILIDSQTVSRLLDSEWYSSDLLTRELGWRARVDVRSGLRALASRPFSE